MRIRGTLHSTKRLKAFYERLLSRLAEQMAEREGVTEQFKIEVAGRVSLSLFLIAINTFNEYLKHV